MLRETPLYAVLSGFSFGDTPVVKTFYDFFHASGRMTKTTFLPKTVSLKGSRQSGKRKARALPCDSSSTASKLLSLLEHWQFKPKNSFFLIFRLYHQQFLSVSCSKGFIDMELLALPQRECYFFLTTSTCMWPPILIVIFLYHLF